MKTPPGCESYTRPCKICAKTRIPRQLTHCEDCKAFLRFLAEIHGETLPERDDVAVRLAIHRGRVSGVPS